MDNAIVPVVLGLFIIVLGLQNRKSNISSVHWYHRKRVTEGDRIPFGRMIGLGTILCGASIALCGGLVFVAQRTQAEIFTGIGTAVAVAGLAAGLALSFYAMWKYNKGIF